MGRRAAFALAAYLAMSSVSVEVPAQEPDQSDAKIEELEQRVEQLEEQIRALETELQSDTADTPAEGSPKRQNLEEPSPPPETSREKALAASLADIQFRESNAANDYANDYTDWISLTFEFTNGFDRDIRAAKGTMVFKDLFGDPWWRIGLTVNDEIPAGETIVWDGTVDYSIWDDAHARARHADADDVVVEYIVDQVLFDDGTRIEF